MLVYPFPFLRWVTFVYAFSCAYVSLALAGCRVSWHVSVSALSVASAVRCRAIPTRFSPCALAAVTGVSNVFLRYGVFFRLSGLAVLVLPLWC